MYVVGIEGSRGYLGHRVVERDPEDVVVAIAERARSGQQRSPHQPLCAGKPKIIVLCRICRGARQRDLRGDLARELGITCVVGCAGAWTQLVDGALVSVDGDAGLVVPTRTTTAT